jgi:hypothetical protein
VDGRISAALPAAQACGEVAVVVALARSSSQTSRPTPTTRRYGGSRRSSPAEPLAASAASLVANLAVAEPTAPGRVIAAWPWSLPTTSRSAYPHATTVDIVAVATALGCKYTAPFIVANAGPLVAARAFEFISRAAHRMRRRSGIRLRSRVRRGCHWRRPGCPVGGPRRLSALSEPRA